MAGLSEKGEQLRKILQPDYDLIRKAISEGADLNEIDPAEGESIYSSLVEDHHHLLTDLISYGAKPTTGNTKGGNPLIYAVWRYDYGLLKNLLEAGADPNAVGYYSDDDCPMTALDALEAQYHCDGHPISNEWCLMQWKSCYCPTGLNTS